MRKLKNVLVAVLLAIAVPSMAFAVVTPIDVTGVTDQVAAAATPIGLIGAAVLLVLVGVKTYKWIRRAL